MNLSVLIVISSVIALTSCAGAPPTKGYYNRRAFPPPSYFYSHKGGFNAGPPIHKYRPPGFRATRNPYLGPAPGQGGHHQPLVQGIPQTLHQGPPQSIQQGPPQVLHQGQQQLFHQAPQQIIHQGQPQILHQGQPHLLHQGQQQVLYQGPQQISNQGSQQVLHQGSHQGQQQIINQGPIQGVHQGQAQVVHQRVPPNVHQSLPQSFYQGLPQNTPQGVTPVLHHPGLQQGHHQGIPQNIQQGPHHSLSQASPHTGQPYQQVSQQSNIFQSLPPKRLTPTPPIFSKTQVVPQFTAAPFKSQPSHLNSIRDDFVNEAASFTVATKSYYKPNDERSPIHTIPAPKLSPADKPADFDARIQLAAQQKISTTPRFKTLDTAVADQIKNNAVANILAQQTHTHFAPDPDPQNVLARVPPSNDPFSQPSNGQLPIDVYLQKQLDNEIAQQESLYVEQQQAEQYQQQLEVAQQLVAQQQAFQIQQENLKQQVLQEQALEAQKQLALQAQALQQQQYQQLPVQQASESLTAEELFNLMNGISPNQPIAQPSTESVQDVLSKPQNQNEISSATTNFQPNYQSFNYDEKAHQQRQVNQQELTNEPVETKRSTSKSISHTDVNPQYQNFNYDEKTKQNGFNNEANNQVVKSEQSANKDKKEKRYQKHAFSANNGYTTGYSTLGKDITESIPQIQYNHQQEGYSTLPVNYNDKQNIRKLKPDNAIAIEVKKHLKKKNRLPNNGYSTIAEDLLQQHDLKNDLQQLTYSTLPNKKIIEVLKQQIQLNSTQQDQNPHIITTEKNSLQRMRETAHKFYNPHILQAVRNNTSNENVQIQQSIQIYENNYASKGDDNHIDLSGITTTSTTAAVSSTASSSTEPTIVTEINVIENNSNVDNDNQESNLYEEIMLQDESKPLEDTYNSNSHSYFGQRIRPKRT